MTGTLHEVVYDNISLNSTQNGVSGKIYKVYQNTLFVFNNFLLKKKCPLWNNLEKYGGAREVTDHMANAFCILDN